MRHVVNRAAVHVRALGGLDLNGVDGAVEGVALSRRRLLDVISPHLKPGGLRVSVGVGDERSQAVGTALRVGLRAVHAVDGARQRIAGVAVRHLRVARLLQEVHVAERGEQRVQTSHALARARREHALGVRRGATRIDQDVVSRPGPSAGERVPPIRRVRHPVILAVARVAAERVAAVGDRDIEHVAVVVRLPGVRAMDVRLPADRRGGGQRLFRRGSADGQRQAQSGSRHGKKPCEAREPSSRSVHIFPSFFAFRCFLYFQRGGSLTWSTDPSPPPL